MCAFTDNSKMDHIEFALHVRLVLTYHDSICMILIRVYIYSGILKYENI